MTPTEVVTDAARAIHLTSEIVELAEKYGIRVEGLARAAIYECGVRNLAPRDLDVVRSFPLELQPAGIEYLLYTLDRTVEDGESGYCADRHAEESREYSAVIVRDTSVRTPNDIVAWLDRKDQATRLHLL